MEGGDGEKDDFFELTSLRSHRLIYQEISSENTDDDDDDDDDDTEISLRTVTRVSKESYDPVRPCELRLKKGERLSILPVPRCGRYCVAKRLKDEKVGVVPIRVFSTRYDLLENIQSEIVKKIANKYIRSGGPHTRSLRSFTQCILSPRCRHSRFLRELKLKKTVQKKWYVADTKKYGRGVFASRDLRKGESIAVCPYIVDTQDSMGGRFMDFAWDESGFSVMVLGCGSLLNHSDKNANTQWRYRDGQFSADDPSIQFIVYETTRDVKKDEEFKINYGEEYWSCETRRGMRKKDEEED